MRYLFSLIISVSAAIVFSHFFPQWYRIDYPLESLHLGWAVFFKVWLGFIVILSIYYFSVIVLFPKKNNKMEWIPSDGKEQQRPMDVLSEAKIIKKERGKE